MKSKLKNTSVPIIIKPQRFKTEWTVVEGEAEVYSVIPDVWDMDKRKKADWNPSKLKILWWKIRRIFIRKSKSRGRCL